MSIAGPSLKSRRLWARREARFLTILERALQLLSSESNLSKSENELNRKLYFSLLTATGDLFPREELLPIYEAQNQPDPDDEARVAREGKRPDFMWKYRDRYESNPERSSREFVVECKRLGAPPRADWVLNRNYVTHGIRRFVDPQHAYAKRFPSAAMVGYWQDMSAAEVLREVNAAAREHDLPPLTLNETGSRRDSVRRLDHFLERPFPVSPMHLNHLWADVRETGDKAPSEHRRKIALV